MNTDHIIASTTKLIVSVKHGKSLASLIPLYEKKLDPKNYALFRQITYGALRHYFSLSFIKNCLLHKPLKNNEDEVDVLILIGLYQLMHTNTPGYAAVKVTVDALQHLKKNWAKGLINALLRNFLRKKNDLLNKITGNLSALYDHPEWFISTCRHDWKQQWRSILKANNSQGPLTLRVNQNKISRIEYLDKLKKNKLDAKPTEFSDVGITLENPCRIQDIPYFYEGLVSIQDEAAQLSADLIDCKPNERILDACSAPGGKLCHLLERTPNVDIDAVDIDPYRIKKIEDNLERLNQKATLICGDVSQPELWWDKKKYDKIILDAPCSATGVIRRNPDIKLLKRQNDIEKLAYLQQLLLSKMWALLKKGGRLVYATCSILDAENNSQIKRFLANHHDATIMSVSSKYDSFKTKYGLQLFPNIGSHDGFFYSVINKK